MLRRQLMRVAWAVIVVVIPLEAGAQVVLGPGRGHTPEVSVIETTGVVRTFLAYNPAFPGGVHVAMGDVNGDGTPDVITGPGAGGSPHVVVFSGTNFQVLASFFAYDPGFRGGVHVAAGDVNGDGRADIITGAGAGGGPHVAVFSGANLQLLASFFAYNPFFPGGVNVAAGDVDGDGRADIITGAGPGGGPHVKVFSGASLRLLASFFAYDPFFSGGVNVAAGDVDGDGHADIITGAGAGGGPHVVIFSGATLQLLNSFFAYDPSFAGGVTVGCPVIVEAQSALTWIQRFPTASPPARLFSAGAFDGARDEVVLFGGARPGGVSGLLNDTWVWDGRSWTQRFPAISPPPMALHSMAYDAARAQVVLFGSPSGPFSVLRQTWTWDGVTWEQKFPATSPPISGSASMAYDAARSEIVLFGGNDVRCACPSNETWTWDGSNWTQRTPLTRPPARFYPAMSYDAVRRESVLFGGEGFSGGLSDTWVWDGVNWTQRFPAAIPAGRRFHGMAAFNALSSTVVMFGGETPSFFPLSDTWVWDGVNWKQLSFTVRPSARSGYVVTYDETRGEVVLFGSTRPDALNDTWVFGADP